MILLRDLIVFLLKHAYPLVEHLDGLLEPVRVREPVLLLKLLHVAEVELGNGRRPVLRLRVLVLNPLRYRVDRRIHQLVEIYRVAAAVP